MKEIVISEKEKNQSLKKFLFRYMKNAPSSFVYKMLRKKNITLNGKKAGGDEVLKAGDTIKLFLSDETIDKFSSLSLSLTPLRNKAFKDIEIIYADSEVLILNKPAGLLSQKADASDISVNDYVLSYAIENSICSMEDIKHFRPSICNRLDRNTSGIIIAGLTLDASRVLTSLIRDKDIEKYYLTAVSGDFSRLSDLPYNLTAYIQKDENINKSEVISIGDYDILSEEKKNAYEKIETVFGFTGCKKMGAYTVSTLRIQLLTGKSHQIRASLKYLGYPVIGDVKYGSNNVNEHFRSTYGIKHHILHAEEIHFPENVIIGGKASAVSGRTFKAKIPDYVKELSI